MRRSLLVLAVLASACQPTADDTPGVFETFEFDRVQPAGCVFVGQDMDLDAPEGVFFATRQDDPDYTAYARFKGETLRLLPRSVPQAPDIQFDVTYDVYDYLNWKIRVQADRGADGLYSGTMTLLETGVDVSIIGRCNG